VRATRQTLTATERAALLDLAAATLERALAGLPPPAPEELDIEITPALACEGGAFVTLRRGRALRGCIGEIRATRPLWQGVQAMAVGAALRDHRFRTVTADELPELTLSISVLTSPEPVAGWEEIVLGRHGILLQRDGRSATFLPQVPTQQGWTLRQTLTQLALKAGLPPDAWRTGATFLVFEAETFSASDATT